MTCLEFQSSQVFFVIGSLEFTTGSSSRSLVCVSQHSLYLGEACSADNRDNAVETNTHRRDREKEPRGELSAVRCQ